MFNVSFAGQLQRFTDNGNGTYTFAASGGTTELKSPASGKITIRNLPGGSYTVSENAAVRIYRYRIAECEYHEWSDREPYISESENTGRNI